MNKPPLPKQLLQELPAKCLKNPAELSPIVHSIIFNHLAQLVQQVSVAQAAKAAAPLLRQEWQKLRLRDWQLVRRENKTICDVFLDKGHSWLQYDDFAGRPGHNENQSIVTIDECVIIHKTIAKDEAFFRLFGEDVVFEIGSAGEEPPLRSIEDFQQAQGLMIALETWTKPKNQDRHKGRLVAVSSLGTEDPKSADFPNTDTAFKVQVMLENGIVKTFDIPEIRHASLLLFDLGNFKN